MTLDEGAVLEFTIIGVIHKQCPQLGGMEGSKIGQNYHSYGRHKGTFFSESADEM